MRNFKTFVALSTITLPSSAAWAQVGGNINQFSTLAGSVISVLQGIALSGCVVGFIKVGYMYSSHDDRAGAALKNTAIGTAVVAGAAIIAQFIKTGMGAS